MQTLKEGGVKAKKYDKNRNNNQAMGKSWIDVWIPSHEAVNSDAVKKEAF